MALLTASYFEASQNCTENVAVEKNRYRNPFPLSQGRFDSGKSGRVPLRRNSVVPTSCTVVKRYPTRTFPPMQFPPGVSVDFARESGCYRSGRLESQRGSNSGILPVREDIKRLQGSSTKRLHSTRLMCYGTRRIPYSSRSRIPYVR